MKSFQHLSKTIGTRTLRNTNHGIYAELTRFGPHEWVVAIVCNGIADWSHTYSTRRVALEVYNETYIPLGDHD